MAALTPAHQRTRAVPEPATRPGLRDAVRSELTKMRSVRSTYYTLIAFFAAGVAYSVINCDAAASAWVHRSSAWHQQFDPADASLGATVVLGELIIVVLGALIMTSEYSTGMIGTSLSTVPRRPVLYAAKAIAFTAVTLSVSLVTSFAAFFAGQGVLSSKHINTTITDPAALRAVLLTAVVVPFFGLLAFGLATVIRSTAGTITAALGIVFLVPVLSQELPSSWQISRWLPGFPGVTTISSTQPPQQYLFGAWGQLAVVAGWTVVAVAAGAWLLQRRDT